MVKNLTDKDFVKETSTGVTLTDFWATWCPPCRMQGPIIEQLDKEIGDKVKITKIDVDANQKTPIAFLFSSCKSVIASIVKS